MTGRALLRQVSRSRYRDEVIGVVIAVFYAVGVAGHYVATFLPSMIVLTPYTLLIFGAIVLVPALREGRLPLVIWAAGTYALTFAAEAIGVATGAIFGSYEYGPTLGARVLGVPLVIGFNWVLVVLGAARVCGFIAERVQRRTVRAGLPARTALLAGVIAAAVSTAAIGVAFDVMLEPVAMNYDYWQWQGGSVPMQNYAGWFLVGLIPAIAWFAFGMRLRTRLPAYYLVIQALFFAALLPASL